MTCMDALAFRMEPNLRSSLATKNLKLDIFRVSVEGFTKKYCFVENVLG